MSNPRKNAFTLMELLVVITVIVLLMLIMLPSFGAARAYARTAKCTANLHSFGGAIATRQMDQALGVFSNSCSMMDLPPYLTDTRVYFCPEDNPLAEIDAKLSAYSGYPHDSKHFLYDMQFGGLSNPAYGPGASYYGDPWVYRTNLSSPVGSFLLNFEDERPGFGDKSFYNNYLRADIASATQYQLQSLNKAPAGDVKPPLSTVGGGPGQSIFGGYSFDLVTLSGKIVKSGFDHNDATNPTALVNYTPFGLSYGMNARYPSQMSLKSNGIIVFDYLRANFDSETETSAQWGAPKTLNTDLGGSTLRPGFARHTGRFNALFLDSSVRTGMVPTVVNPTSSNPSYVQVKKAWWGAP